MARSRPREPTATAQKVTTTAADPPLEDHVLRPTEALDGATISFDLPIRVSETPANGARPRTYLRELPILPAPSPKAQFVQFITMLQGIDISLSVVHRRLVAALLVEHVYIWNTLALRHRARNTLVRVIEQLGRNTVLKTLRQDGGADEIRRMVLSLLDDPVLGSRPRPDISSIFEDNVRHFVATSELSGVEFAEIAPHFATYLQGYYAFHFRPDCTPVVVIPGIDRLVLNGLPNVQADTAIRLVAVRLVELLRDAYQSPRNTIGDALKILCAAFPEQADELPDEEAFRAQRWRGRPDAFDEPLVRLLAARNLDVLAKAVNNRREARDCSRRERGLSRVPAVPESGDRHPGRTG